MLKIKNETYLNVSESAEKIGRANQTVYQHWRKWGWNPYKFGQTLLFRESQIQFWLESQIKELII